MGVFDDLSNVFGKAQAQATRIADTASVKFKLSEAERKRRDCMARLGESLYGEVRENPSLREGREALLADIAQHDADCVQLRSELDRIAKEAAEAKASAYACPVCGGTLVAGARFCPTCGAQMQPPASAGQCAAEAAYTQAAQPQQPAQPAQDASQADAGAAHAQEPPAHEQSYEVPGK